MALLLLPNADLIDLAVGDPSDTPPAALRAALEGWTKDPRATHYTPSHGENALLEAVSHYYMKTHHVPLEPGTQICVTQGARPALFFALLALHRPGSPVGFISPSYVGFKPIIADVGMRAVPFETAAWPSTSQELDQMFSRLTGGCFILNNPHNPVGFVISTAQIEKLVAVARRHNVRLISDAVYSELHDGAPTPSLLEFDSAAVEVMSISKTFRACGWRVGAVAGNGAWMREIRNLYVAMNGVPFAYQMVFAQALTDQVEVEDFRNELKMRRSVLVEGLRGIGFSVDAEVHNRGGIFVWAGVPAGWRCSSDEAAALVRQVGVGVTSGLAFGSAGEGYLRLALNVPTDMLVAAIDRIATVEAK